ncbi:MAG: hypothetical protein QXU32_11900 [Nitrososphaerales archaeon]
MADQEQDGHSFYDKINFTVHEEQGSGNPLDALLQLQSKITRDDPFVQISGGNDDDNNRKADGSE